MRYITGGLGPDTTFSANNTVVTANASKALRRLRRGQRIDTVGQRALALGANLLTTILNGSIFMETADVGRLTQPTSTDDVWAYSHALATIQQLDVAKDKPLADALADARDNLLQLASGHDVPATRLASLEQFFNTLNNIFYTDIYNGLIPARPAEDTPGEAVEARH